MSSGDTTGGNILDIKLEDLDLSVRARNCCDREHVATLGDLTKQTEGSILNWRGAGLTTLKEIRTVLNRYGLNLGAGEASLAAGAAYLDLETAGVEQQRKLTVRLRDLPMSTRATKLMKNAKLIYLGDLLQLTDSDVLRLPNSGRTTLGEIHRLVRSFGFGLNVDIHGWSAERARKLELALTSEIKADRLARSSAALADAGPPSTFLEEELKRVIRVVEKDRNVDLLTKLWGWGGEEPRTLESVGQDLDLTRERVRQVEKRAVQRLARFEFDLPFVYAAINVLRDHAPDLHHSLAAALQQDGISRTTFSVLSLERVTQLLKVRWPFADLTVGDKRFLALRPEVALYKQVPSAARRKASTLGCTNLSWLAADRGLNEASVGPLRSLLQQDADIEWLDANKEWFFFKGSRNRLRNVCSKTLGVCSSIRLPELRRAVSRSRRLGMAPPTHILGRFIELSGLGVVADNIVTANPAHTTAPSEHSAEGILLKALDEFGPVIDGDELAERCIAAGMNATTFFIYRIASPVLVSLGRGVYGKVGCEVPPGLIDQIADRKKRTRALVDSGWNAAGRYWFAVQLPRIVLVGGSIRLPSSSAAKTLTGRWLVRLPDGTTCGYVECSDQFIWRFRSAFVRLSAEPFDYASFEFDIRQREVLLRVGGLDVVETAQSAPPLHFEEPGADET